MARIRCTKAISPPQELEGGAHSTPNFNLTSQGVQRAHILWPKATSPPQELEGGAHSTPYFNFTSQGARRAPSWWPKDQKPSAGARSLAPVGVQTF